MNMYRVIAAVALVGAVGISGCQSTSKALGMSKVTPDEFRVVTKAPLVVPPDYSLRPPAPGEPRPQELQPESAARAALMGQSLSAERSEGERLLVAKAGLDRADPLIRYVIDDEFGDIAHKEKSFADRVLFWRGNDAAPPAQAQTGAAAPVVDAQAEEERLEALTGGKAVIIKRERDARIKLPGL